MELKYFYGNEVKHFAFYQIPKALFTDEHFRGISPEAKIIYSLLLDRMSLSVKNGWTDADGKVYIVYTVSEVMDAIGCGDRKAVRILRRFDVVGFISYFVESTERGTKFSLQPRKKIFRKYERQRNENKRRKARSRRQKSASKGLGDASPTSKMRRTAKTGNPIFGGTGHCLRQIRGAGLGLFRFGIFPSDLLISCSKKKKKQDSSGFLFLLFSAVYGSDHSKG